MNYARKSFTVSPPAGQEYAERYEKTFGEVEKTGRCRSALFSGTAKGNCTLEAGHAGKHSYSFLTEPALAKK